MTHFESIKEAVGRNASNFATRLRYSLSSVYKWMEPSGGETDSGNRNPVELLEEIIEYSETLKNNPTVKDRDILNPTAPIEYLAHRFGLAVVELPDLSACKDPDTLMEKFNAEVKEAGDFLSVTAKAVADGTIARDEFSDIEKEGWEAIHAMLCVIEVARLNMKANRNKRRQP